MKLQAFLTQLKFSNSLFSFLASVSILICSLTVQTCHWGYIYSGNGDWIKTLLLYISLSLVMVINLFVFIQKVIFLKKYNFFGNKNNRLVVLILEGSFAFLAFVFVAWSHKFSFSNNPFFYISFDNSMKVNITPTLFGIIFFGVNLFFLIYSYISFSKKIDKLCKTKLLDFVDYNDYFSLISTLELKGNKLHVYIKVIRKKAKLNQDKFGDLLGVSVSTVSHWEKGIHIPKRETINYINTIFSLNIEQ